MPPHKPKNIGEEIFINDYNTKTITINDKFRINSSQLSNKDLGYDFILYVFNILLKISKYLKVFDSTHLFQKK